MGSTPLGGCFAIRQLPKMEGGEEAGELLSVEEVSVRVRLAVEISREKMKSEMVIATL